jgi:hypothetical protein
VKLARLVVEARYYCRKCARVANREDVLCKPRELPPSGAKGDDRQS